MRSIIFFLFTLYVVDLNAQQYGSITDSRDDRKYKTVNIGNQVWMAENLNADKFRNGDPIPKAETNEEWEKAGKNKQPAWCYSNNRAIQDDPQNGEKFGKLYNWYAVSDPRGLAPVGWHIPSDDEWTILTNYLGGEEVAGTKMKSTTGWHGNGNGTNKSGFSGLPGGSRGFNGSFNDIGKFGCWWSSSQSDTTFAWTRNLGYSNGFVDRYYYSKELGLTVRCVKD